jgi:hypothetical protein
MPIRTAWGSEAPNPTARGGPHTRNPALKGVKTTQRPLSRPYEVVLAQAPTTDARGAPLRSTRVPLGLLYPHPTPNDYKCPTSLYTAKYLNLALDKST